MKKNKQHRSLTFTFLRWLALFSITVLVLLVTINIREERHARAQERRLNA